MRGDSGVYKQYLIMLQVYEWSCCSCMITRTTACFHWSSLIMLQLPEGSCSNCMIMLKRHWLTHLVTKLGRAMLSGYSLDQLCWFGPRMLEHAQPCDLQLGITVSDWLIPRAPYVSQRANTQVWYTKIAGESIRILGLFSHLTRLGVRMALRLM